MAEWSDWYGPWLSYGEVNARANRVANGLLARGIGRGDVVATLLPNGAEHLPVGSAGPNTHERNPRRLLATLRGARISYEHHPELARPPSCATIGKRSRRETPDRRQGPRGSGEHSRLGLVATLKAGSAQPADR